MSKIICFGSLNIDKVYQVPHIVRPGETLSGTAFEVGCGGKGGNQSIALARAGAKVLHAGCVGTDGKMLTGNLNANGVNTDLVKVIDQPTGHAIIQVDAKGENSIILFPGANHGVTNELIEEVMATTSPGDYILLQNEINLLPDIINKAAAADLTVCLNFAPFDPETAKIIPLDKVDILIVNEHEGAGLTGSDEPEKIIEILLKKYPGMTVVLTLGSSGVSCANREESLKVDAEKVENVVDTTAAGDTFTGYFLEAMARGMELEKCIQRGCKAAAITVSRPGAADSIPFNKELL